MDTIIQIIELLFIITIFGFIYYMEYKEKSFFYGSKIGMQWILSIVSIIPIGLFYFINNFNISDDEIITLILCIVLQNILYRRFPRKIGVIIAILIIIIFIGWKSMDMPFFKFMEHNATIIII